MKIKSTIISMALLLLCVTGIKAQKDEAFLGAKVGMNIANVTNYDNTDPRIGLNIGLMGEYFITDMFAVQGELLYSMQGYKMDIEGVDATTKLDYLNIPVLAKIYPTGGLNIFAGPQFGFCVNSKVKAEKGSLSSTEDIKDDVNTFDFGLAIGAGYDFPMGLTADFRWTPSFTNILKDVDDDYNCKNSVFTISLGYKF